MTPEREKKFKRVASNRQTDVTVILENITDMHNVGAVLRTCDSVGIAEIYVVMDESVRAVKNYSVGKKTSSGAGKWVDVHEFGDIESCIKTVRERYKRIIGTIVTESAHSLYECELTSSCALLFGNEHAGMSGRAQELIDEAIYIPQVGMVESLNISVSCAISLYEMMRQRLAAGMYGTDEGELRNLQLYETYVQRHESKIKRNPIIRH